MNTSILSSEQRINNAVQLAKQQTDPYAQSLLAAHICVLACGHLEDSIRTLLTDHARNHAREEVASYVGSRLGRVHSPSWENIENTLAGFGFEWTDDFLRWADGEVRDQTASLVARRHQIAHGKHAGISIGIMSDYWSSARCLVKELSTRLDAN